MVDYTVDCSVYVVHCTVDCSIDRCVVSCTNYDFSSMIGYHKAFYFSLQGHSNVRLVNFCNVKSNYDFWCPSFQSKCIYYAKICKQNYKFSNFHWILKLIYIHGHAMKKTLYFEYVDLTNGKEFGFETMCKYFTWR